MSRFVTWRVVLSVLARCFESAWGYSSYVVRLPNTSLAIGHNNNSGGALRNQFGEHFKAQGYVWSKALCQMDSDGDGKTNGYELGDPCCVWSEGTSDWKGKRTTGITYPGVASSVAASGYDCPSDATPTSATTPPEATPTPAAASPENTPTPATAAPENTPTPATEGAAVAAGASVGAVPGLVSAAMAFVVGSILL